MFSVNKKGIRDKGFEVMDASALVFDCRIGGNHGVEDQAEDGEGCGLAARHFRNVGSSGYGEVLSRKSNEFPGGVKLSIDEPVVRFRIGGG